MLFVVLLALNIVSIFILYDSIKDKPVNPPLWLNVLHYSGWFFNILGLFLNLLGIWMTFGPAMD